MVHFKIVYKVKHNPALVLLSTSQVPKLNYYNIQQQLLTIVKRHKAVRHMFF